MKCFQKAEDNYILNEHIEGEIVQLQYSIDELQSRLDEKKEMLLKEIEENSELYDNFKANKVKLTYVRKTTKETFDSKKFKEENLDLYNKYIKISDVKSSLRLKIDNK